MANTAENSADVIATAMRLAAERGWRAVTLADIAEEAGLTLSELYERHPSKASIVEALVREADVAMLAAADREREEDETVRDRLFDLLMARFDALQPHKDGIAAVLRDNLRDPLCGPPAALYWGGRTLRSMRWALEAAGVQAGGSPGTLRANGLLAVYARTFLVWLRDESEDMSRTMATLDRRLAQAERLARFCPGRRRPREPEPEEPAQPPPGERRREPRTRRPRGGRRPPRTRPAPA